MTMKSLSAFFCKPKPTATETRLRELVSMFDALAGPDSAEGFLKQAAVAEIGELKADQLKHHVRNPKIYLRIIERLQSAGLNEREAVDHLQPELVRRQAERLKQVSTAPAAAVNAPATSAQTRPAPATAAPPPAAVAPQPKSCAMTRADFDQLSPASQIAFVADGGRLVHAAKEATQGAFARYTKNVLSRAQFDSLPFEARNVFMRTGGKIRN